MTTWLKLLNVSGGAQQLTLESVAKDGSELAEPRQVSLASNESLQANLGELLGLSDEGSGSVGSLRITSTSPGAIGDVVFGDPDEARFLAALPLQRRLLSRAILSQVANLPGVMFTGVALFNPGGVTAQVTIRVFTAECVETGSAVVDLAGGTRISKLVPELVPASEGQAGGYIVVESTEGVVIQQLFAGQQLDFMSAVPANSF